MEIIPFIPIKKIQHDKESPIPEQMIEWMNPLLDHSGRPVKPDSRMNNQPNEPVFFSWSKTYNKQRDQWSPILSIF